MSRYTKQDIFNMVEEEDVELSVCSLRICLELKECGDHVQSVRESIK